MDQCKIMKKKQVDTRKGRHLTRKKEYQEYYLANKVTILAQQRLRMINKVLSEKGVIANNNQEVK